MTELFPFSKNRCVRSSVRRAIDLHEGDKINEPAFKDLIRAAVALNVETKSQPKRSSSKR
jgi:hypothetical protein